MKKRLNSKGFTLVELLAVMVILVAIMLIALPSITSSIARSENKKKEAQKELILSTVAIKLDKEAFDKKIYQPGVGLKQCCLLVGDLADKGIIDDKLKEGFEDALIMYDDGVKFKTEDFDCLECLLD